MIVRTASRLAVLAVFLLAAVLGFGAPVLAHNQLISSDPADGASIAQAPAEVELVFLSSLDPDNAEVAVTGPDGASVVAGEPAFDGVSVTIPVAAPVTGDYQVAYEVLSNDGHWADGTITFTVTQGEPAPTRPPPAAPSPSPVAPGPEPATSPTATSAEGDAGGGLPWWGWLLVALVLAGGAYASYRLSRRRSRSR